MATATRHGAAGVRERTIEAKPTRDRDVLRAFLERDRLRAAYALCDLEDREFARTKWGVATERGEPISVVLEYGGLTPQPLFVMGDADGISAILRDVIRPRLVYLAADESLLPSIEEIYRIDRGPQMIRMRVNRQMFVPVQGPVARLAPADIVDLKSALWARLRRLVAVGGNRDRRLLRRSRGRPVGGRGRYPRDQPQGGTRRRRQRDDPRRLPRSGLRQADDKRRDPGAAAQL